MNGKKLSHNDLVLLLIVRGFTGPAQQQRASRASFTRPLAADHDSHQR